MTSVCKVKMTYLGGCQICSFHRCLRHHDEGIMQQQSLTAFCCLHKRVKLGKCLPQGLTLALHGFQCNVSYFPTANKTAARISLDVTVNSM